MKSPTNKPVGIIGGGLGGLAAACTLAARGHRVVLFERNAWLGGKAAVLEAEGYRFDMGPTIVTLPSVLKRIFAEAKRPLREYLEMVPLDPQWRCFFDSGKILDLVSATDRMVNNLDQFTGNAKAGDGYRRFMELSRRLHDISDRYFFWKSIGGLKDMFDAKATFRASTLKDVLTMRMGRSVAGLIRSFVPDAEASQMFDHYTQYVGSSPYGSPAVLGGIAHMQAEEGIWYPLGGTRAVPTALERLARDLGVEFRTNCLVSEICQEKGRVTGVRTEDGQLVALEAVVSNSDSVLTHRELVPSPVSTRFANRRAYEPACSGVVLYLGLKKAYPHLLHHNFVFSQDPKREFDSIYRQGEPAPDPTCYVCAPARTEPAVAPEGGEALYVLVHTPYLRDHHDWSKILPTYRRVILEKLRRVGGMDDLESRITFEAALTPQEIQDRYHVWKGAIYGLASHGRFLGAFKPANRSPDLSGFYLAGGSAHPGPGMPMVMMSGWIAADSLDQDRPAASEGDRSMPSQAPEMAMAGLAS